MNKLELVQAIGNEVCDECGPDSDCGEDPLECCRVLNAMDAIDAYVHTVAHVRKRVFRIWNKAAKKYEGVYSRAHRDEYDFTSIERARSSNVHDIYKDEEKYDIHEFEVTEKRVKDGTEPI